MTDRRHASRRHDDAALLTRQHEFLATLGHELRNPLAPIQSSLEILKLAGAFDRPESAQPCAVMERQVQYLNRLVDDLLEVSRVTRGVIAVRREAVDLTTVIGAALETSRPILETMCHEVTTLFDANPTVVNGDPLRLTQVFANLVNNAAKYTNHGGHISVTTRREHDQAVVSVKDDGIGITPQMLPSIFDLFMQVDRSTRRSQGGLGIGLTLVRSLVNAHDGTVEARSDGPGHGSEFVVRLPLMPGAQVAPKANQRIQPLPPKRILVVDDSRDAGESLALLLRMLGAEVALVHSGHAALECIGTLRPDIVLLDIGMPEMDGYEVARRIRAEPANRNVQLIAVTGWGQDEDRQRSAKAGFNHHLVKPADVDKLRQLLSMA